MTSLSSIVLRITRDGYFITCLFLIQCRASTGLINYDNPTNVTDRYEALLYENDDMQFHLSWHLEKIAFQWYLLSYSNLDGAWLVLGVEKPASFSVQLCPSYTKIVA